MGSKMLVLGGIAENTAKGLDMLNENIENGKGLKKFEEIIKAQGGNPAALYDYNLLRKAPFSLEVKAAAGGFVYEINTYEIGKASADLGAGRLSKDDKIDLNAGIIMKKRLGDSVKPGETIAEVFAKSKGKCIDGANIIKGAVCIKKKIPEKKTLIFKELD
ncbi:MAG: hypothetical protein LUH47_08430 [Clostridiales bacterium]|nr:hypothetical protein [Clostridiales bacterium]